MPYRTKPRGSDAPPVRGRLTKDKIIQAAMKIMDEEGLDAVTMRRVAREVGVEAMSLYNHVRDKEDLLDGVCSCVMRDFQLPEDQADLYASARDIAHEWRRILKSHPNVMSLFAERQKPLSDPKALIPIEIALEILGRLGLNQLDTVKAFHVFGGYIMGFVMMEVGQMFGSSAFRGDTPSARELARSLPVDEFPALAASLAIMADCDPDEQFDFGLDLLLAGLQSQLSAH